MSEFHLELDGKWTTQKVSFEIRKYKSVSVPCSEYVCVAHRDGNSDAVQHTRQLFLYMPSMGSKLLRLLNAIAQYACRHTETVPAVIREYLSPAHVCDEVVVCYRIALTVTVGYAFDNFLNQFRFVQFHGHQQCRRIFLTFNGRTGRLRRHLQRQIQWVEHDTPIE